MQKIFDIDRGWIAKPNDAPTQHMTMIFHAFVMLTLFNEINARKIHGERNVLRGIFVNPIFYVIWIMTVVLQTLIVQFGSVWFQCATLTLDQWLWCMCIGVSSLLWAQACCGWATAGECDVNPFFMKLNCQKACGTCGYALSLTNTAPCATTVNTEC